MTPQEMLTALSDMGDGSSDYNDGLYGWFSWHIDPQPALSTLVITWQPYDADAEKPGERHSLTWILAGPLPRVD